MQCFHVTVNRVRTRFPEEPGNRFESSVHSVLRFADPANVGKSLLDGNKDHLLHQACSELMKQEHQVASLNNCIDELQQQARAQRLELEDAHHGFFESRREQFRFQEARFLVSIFLQLIRPPGAAGIGSNAYWYRNSCRKR